MHEYRVTPRFDEWFPLASDVHARIGTAIHQLVQRYGLAGSSVLSLAGGTCAEERFLLGHGVELTVVDIDERGQVEPELRSADPGPLRYLIADADNVEGLGSYDLLYSSSFTPDEMRRDAIAHRSAGPEHARMVEANGHYEWPWWEQPFHPTLMRLTRDVRPGGLVIIQSYYGGLDILVHRYYLWACDRQLAAAGLQLRELYRFRTTVGVCLYVATRGSRALPLASPLTLFHGRAPQEQLECLRIAGPPPEPPR